MKFLHRPRSEGPWVREWAALSHIFQKWRYLSCGSLHWEIFLEINFWPCAGWDCWLSHNRRPWLEIALLKTISAPQVVANLLLIFPAYKVSPIKLLSLVLAKQTCVLGTEIPAEFLFFVFIEQFRWLQEDRQETPKVSIAENTNTVFNELKHKPLVGLCIFLS